MSKRTELKLCVIALVLLADAQLNMPRRVCKRCACGMFQHDYGYVSCDMCGGPCDMD